MTYTPTEVKAFRAKKGTMVEKIHAENDLIKTELDTMIPSVPPAGAKKITNAYELNGEFIFVTAT